MLRLAFVLLALIAVCAMFVGLRLYVAVLTLAFCWILAVCRINYRALFAYVFSGGVFCF